MFGFVFEVLGVLFQSATVAGRPWLACLLAAPFIVVLLLIAGAFWINGGRIAALVIALFAAGLSWLAVIAWRRFNGAP